MGLEETLLRVVATLSAVAVLITASLGLAVIFGMMRVINLAHGEFIMAGAYVTFLGTTHYGLPLGLAILLSGVAVGLLGLVVERTIVRPLYGRLIDTMLATWGLSLVMTQVAVITAGPFGSAVGTPFGSISVGTVSVAVYSLVLILAAGALVAFAYVVLTKTSYGLRAQAVTQSPDMAASLGIDSGRVNMWTFAFGAFLAGIAGGLFAPLFAVTPVLGQAFIAQVFLAIILAGPAVISGTVASSTLLASVSSGTSFVFTAVVGQALLLVTAVVVLRFFRSGISTNWRRPL